MKRYTSILLFFMALSALAQPVQINRYEYWLNRQMEDKVVTDISPAEQAAVLVNIDASHLPDGLNSFTIRFSDSEEIWSSALTRFFVKIPVSENGSGTESHITKLEYRFNRNEMVQQNLTSGQSFTFEETLSAASLPDGLNSFSIRFRDNAGLWSSMNTRFFVKMPVLENVSGEPRQVVAYEYRFNQGEMVQQSVTADADISIDEIISAAGLPDGLNSISIRFKDNAGLWSSVLTRFFVKMPLSQGVGEGNDLIAYQLWFNDNFAGANQMSIESGMTFSIVENVSTEDLLDGLNRVNIRFRDERGTWSSVVSRFFVKNPVTPFTGVNLMTAYEYWVEDDQGNQFDVKGQEGRTYVELDEPINPLLLDLNLDLKKIQKGDYYLMFRFLDTRGLWSGILAREVEKMPYPIADFGLDENELCGGGTVIFSNYSIDTDTWHWDFGDGSESMEFEPEHTYDQVGEYTIILTATDSGTGIESKTEQIVAVYPVFEITEHYNICQGESLTWQGDEYHTPGEYHKVLQTVNGCDSVYVLILGENPVYEFTETERICNGEFFEWHGVQYTEKGVYTSRYETINGCDSLYTLLLEVFTIDNSVTVEGNTLTAITENAFYQWINCADHSEIEGATNASFTPTQTGSYAVKIEKEGCITISECIDVVISFIPDPYLFTGVYLFPNPARDQVNIIFETDMENYNISILGINGQRIIKEKNISGREYRMSLSGLTPGIYLLEIESGGYARRLKLVRE
jgi:PKD repeat protein